MLPPITKLKTLCFPWGNTSMLFHHVPLNLPVCTHTDSCVPMCTALYSHTEQAFSRLSTTYSYFP